MSDLANKLRIHAENNGDIWHDKAADEIEALEQQLAKVRAALEPFAKVGLGIDERLADHMCHHYDHFVGHYRAAVDAAEAGGDREATDSGV